MCSNLEHISFSSHYLLYGTSSIKICPLTAPPEFLFPPVCHPICSTAAASLSGKWPRSIFTSALHSTRKDLPFCYHKYIHFFHFAQDKNVMKMVSLSVFFLYNSSCMESTGKYWIPVYSVLENDCSIVLAHPKYVKTIRGKKTDKKDAKWIADQYF